MLKKTENTAIIIIVIGMRSVYIHIPFCNSICSYCDFCKFLYDEVWASEYLTHLEKEIDENYDGDEIRTIYIGGGTPSALSISNLNKLMSIVKKFKAPHLEEFTFEMNVNDITIEKLLILKQNRVNRISIGIESFDKYNLKYLNRKHEKEDIISKVSKVKTYFDNVNVDLIYALPIESMETLRRDVREVLKLDVPHISTYSLIIENNTVLGVKKTKPISEDLDYKMYKYICKSFNKAGYKHYEVSNFAKEGYESKHNLTYWNNEEYYGFGLGSHGFISELRYENTRSFNTYLRDEYKFNEMFLSKREDMENHIILGLRKLKGIDIVEFFNKYDTNIQDEFNITDMLRKGFLKIEGQMLFIPEEHIYIMNSILGEILKQK